MLPLPQQQHHQLLRQQRQQYGTTSRVASAAAKNPAAAAKTQRTTTTTADQQQAWVSNDHLWRQGIAQKHAQRRRRQHLERPPSFALAADSALPQRHLEQQGAAPVIQGAPPASAKALTKALGTAGDAGQLLLLLLSTQQQCDAIHVSAAANQCARGLVLDLSLPPGDSQQQQQPRSASLEQQQASAQLQWLASRSNAATLQEAQLWFSQQQQQQQSPEQQPTGSIQTDWLLLLVLSRMVQQHAGSMSGQQLCTCLACFTQLLQQHPQVPLLLAPPLRAACQQLLLSAHRQLQQLDARGLSLVLHAAAGMACSMGGFSPGSRFMLSWFRASRPKLQGANYLDLAMISGALGRMQVFPPAEWMGDFWSASKVGGACVLVCGESG